MNINMDTVRQRLDGVGFPASKHDVMVWATEHGAGGDELDMLEKLPVDNFDSMQHLLGSARMLQQRQV
jgi:hypothetical protein